MTLGCDFGEIDPTPQSTFNHSHPMKTIRVRALLLGLILCSAFTAASRAADDKDIQTLFQMGRTAYYQGNIEQAKKLLNQVLLMNPRHFETRAILANINATMTPGQASLKTTYNGVIIPKFEVNSVSLGESLEALTLMTKNISNGKVSPNFVVKNADLNKANLTLSLANTPLDELVRYLAEMAKAKVTWDKHAVVFSGLSD